MVILRPEAETPSHIDLLSTRPESAASRPKRLFRQPGGFEGFGPVHVERYPNDLVPAEGEKPAIRGVGDFDSAVPADVSLVRKPSEDVVASVKRLRLTCLDRFPGAEPTPREIGTPSMPSYLPRTSSAGERLASNSTFGSRGSTAVAVSRSSKARRIRRTISTFSCDIARAVSRESCAFHSERYFLDQPLSRT